jgi:murein DD-endopeptidase MepM/ murein hydrolase activator NlpD
MKFHRGLDLAAPAGMSVVPAFPGTVISAGYESGYGNTVLVQHAGGLQTRYGHLGSIYVNAGETISSEDALGTVGNSGRSTGAHLHFEVIRDGVAVNPSASLGLNRPDPTGRSKS